MRRTLVTLLSLALGLGGLLWLAGGVRGPGAAAPGPEVETGAPAPSTETAIVPPGVDLPLAFQQGRNVSVPSAPEPLKFTDRETGETVLIPAFTRYSFEARRFGPAESRTSGRQAAEFTDVRVRIYREPRTLEEAKAYMLGLPGAEAGLLHLHVYAAEAHADFLVEDLSISSERSRPADSDALISLSGGVRVLDMEENFVVEGEELELQPGLGKARGRGVFVVRQHEAFEITGEDLELSRTENADRVELRENVVATIEGDLPGPEAGAIAGLGSGTIEPGHVRSEGGAVIVREEVFGVDRVKLDLRHRVHAEQKGGRTLDAEWIQIVAFRKKPAEKAADAGPRAATSGWRVHRFEADGGVIVQYPDETDEGAPFLVSIVTEKMIHEIADDGTSSTTLQGRPELTLRGNIPMDGLSRVSTGLLHATASEQVWLGPPAAAYLPPDASPNDYLRVVLSGKAHIERRDADLDPAWDTLDGDRLEMLLKKETAVKADADTAATVEGVEAAAPVRNTEHLIAVSFAMNGDVQIGGSRMSGMTGRLVAERLDTDAPVLVAEGPRTSFAFHGLKQGERLLGGGNENADRTDAGANSADRAEHREAWVVESLRALGGLDIETSLGGATVGIPARLEGQDLVYDRTSDRARVLGWPTGPARLYVGPRDAKRHVLRARTFTVARGTGTVEARGSVRATAWIREPAQGSPPEDAIGLAAASSGSPATFGVATNGRIEIRMRLGASERTPLLNADQVIRIEGDVVAEVVADSTAVDRLRAAYLEIALRRTIPEPEARASAGMARTGTRPSRTTPPTRPSRATGEARAPVRWDLEAEILSARFGAKGFESIEALEGARLASKEGVVRGHRIQYEALARRVSVVGRPNERAQAVFGDDDTKNEVWAPQMGLRWGEAGPEVLDASAPASAVLIRKGEGKGEKDPLFERFTVTCDGPVTVTSDELTTNASVVINRHLRRRPGEAWTNPARLWTDRLVVKGKNLLTGEAADVLRVIASGPNTVFQVGEGEELTTVWGDLFELEVATSLATLTGRPGRDMLIQRGPRDNERARSSQSRIVLDLETGWLRDLDHAQFVLRGRKK